MRRRAGTGKTGKRFLSVSRGEVVVPGTTIDLRRHPSTLSNAKRHE